MEIPVSPKLNVLIHDWNDSVNRFFTWAKLTSSLEARWRRLRLPRESPWGGAPLLTGRMQVGIESHSIINEQPY
jgi:hypothetical protein